MGGGYAWVTLATNDSYSLGALVLAHSLKQVGTKQSLVVLVTPGVTGSMRSKLSSVFDIVHDVNILDSKDESNLRLLKRPELGVTFTKLHCWRLTQFEKCVFLDADTLVLQNCDELFDREELSAAPDIGWPDCFNSGVFVYRPSNETYEKLVQFALEKGSFDGGDQGLLNLYFSDWSYKDISKHLPFIYNMSSTATYSYLPAFKQFGGDAKIIHFIAGTKPWLQYFNTETKQVQAPNDLRHLTSVLQHWWNIFCNCVHSNLTPDMSGLAGAFAQLTLGVARTAEQIALDDHLRRQGWEIGNIDYLGRDSFDNIWSKICETLASGPALPQPKEPSPPKTEVIQSSGTVVPAKETPTQVKPTEVQTPLQTQTDKTETETPPSPKTDAPTESPAQQGTPLPEPPKQSGEIIQTATKPDTPTPITPDTTAPTKPIDTITATSPGPTSEIPIPQQSKIEEKTEKLETESDKATSNIETVAQKPEEPKSLPTEILNKSETEVPPKTEAPIPKTEVPIEAKAAAKTETPVTSVQPPESKTETTTTVADKPETIATSIETMELTQTKPETQLATPTDIQAAKSEATTTVQLEAPTKDKPPESPKTEPASTTQSSPATAPEELVCTKSAEEKQTPAVAKTEEQKQPPSATTTEGPACPKPTDLACVKPVEQKQSPTPSATATATSPKPEELVCAKPTEQKQAPISPATEFKPSPKPTEQKQPPATVPAPAEQKQPPAPVPAPAEQKQSPAPVPAPAEQKQSPAPVPAPAEQKQSPASVPAPAEQKQSPAPVPAPTEQKQPPVPASATTESTACSKPEKVEEPKAHATAEPVTEKPAKLDTTKVEPKPKEEKKATETLSDPQPKVKEGTEPAQSKGGDGSTGSTPTPPPRKGSSGTKKTKSKK